MWAPLPALFYDRLLAASKTEGTVVFLLFLSDYAGYFATTGLLLYKGLGTDHRKDVLRPAYCCAKGWGRTIGRTRVRS